MFGKAERMRRYLREEMYPSIFCAGCGIGNVLNYTLRAIERLQIDMDRVVFLSGIGCSSRLPGYVDADGLHTTHGRPLAFATGLKLANPELIPIIFTGDGDLAAIGGNHFIHAARRNVDMTVIAINNFNYGMTGGQSSPTTPPGGYTTTSPYGNLETPFDLAQLARGAGAPFIARWPVGYPYETIDTLAKAIAKPGFAFVEMLVPCPTGYGRPNRIEEGKAGWDWFKDQTVLVSEYRKWTPEERAASDRIVIGELWDIERKEYCQEWRNLVEKLEEQSQGGADQGA